MNKIQIFLSRRSTGIVFTIVSILAMNCWQQVLPNFEYDNSYIISAAKNISEGHGYSIKMVSAEDLSKIYYAPLNKWPPGNSWLLVFIHKLFNTDWIHTVYILNAIGLTLLVLVFRKILFQLEYPAWIIHIAVLYFGFLKHPFHFSSNSDLFGLLFFLLGLTVLLNAVKSERNIRAQVLLAAFLFGVAAYMKYLYLPLSYIPFISLLCYAYLIKRTAWRSAAVTGCVFLTFILFSLLIFQYSHSGQMLYINPSKTGFFPEQLLWLAPVIPSTFLNLDFLNMQVSTRSHISYETMNGFWFIVDLLCIGLLTWLSYKIFRYKLFKVRDFRSFYAIQAFLFTAALFGYLFLLSVVKNRYYPDTFSLWVYVQEFRYYVVFDILVIQFAILLILNPSFFFNDTGKFIFRYLMAIILIEEIGHGTYYGFKQIVLKKNYGVAIVDDQIYFKSLALTTSEFKNSKNLVFCSNSHKIANMSSLAGVPIFYDLGKLKYPVPSSLPVTLILAVDNRIPGFSVPILSSPSVKPNFVFQNVYYYVVKIPQSVHF